MYDMELGDFGPVLITMGSFRSTRLSLQYSYYFLLSAWMSSAFSRFHACERRSQHIRQINFIFTILWILGRLCFNFLLLLAIYNSKIDPVRTAYCQFYQ